MRHKANVLLYVFECGAEAMCLRRFTHALTTRWREMENFIPFCKSIWEKSCITYLHPVIGQVSLLIYLILFEARPARIIVIIIDAIE